MEIRIYNQDSSTRALEHFCDYLNRNLPDGVSSPLVEKSVPAEGEMGSGILGSVKLILDSINKPLVELVICLRKYVETYKTTLTIPTPNGLIEIKVNKGMTAAEIESLIVNALREAGKKGDV